LRCSDDKIEAGRKEFRELVLRLTRERSDAPLWAWVKQVVSTTPEERLTELDEMFDECGPVAELRANIDELIELTTDWRFLLDAYIRIDTKVQAYFGSWHRR